MNSDNYNEINVYLEASTNKKIWKIVYTNRAGDFKIPLDLDLIISKIRLLNIGYKVESRIFISIFLFNDW